MTKWTVADMPDQSGRTVLITGANSGIGVHTARVLAAKGAKVLLACRSREKGEQALRSVPGGAVVSLDLADLGSVRSAAASVRELTGDRLDVLINNAGGLVVTKTTTKDGFELQFGVNHLGHAALTWLLMPALRNAGESRVVTLSSPVAHSGKLDLNDPNFERRRYNPLAAYGQSKLANQVFALELDRRLRDAGDEIISVAAHPGYTATNFTTSAVRSYPSPVARAVLGTLFWIEELLVAQPVAMGALPGLYAATAPRVNGGDYIGPGGLGGMRGYPALRRPARRALDRQTGAGLWDLTAKLTGVAPDPGL